MCTAARPARLPSRNPGGVAARLFSIMFSRKGVAALGCQRAPERLLSKGRDVWSTCSCSDSLSRLRYAACHTCLPWTQHASARRSQPRQWLHMSSNRARCVTLTTGTSRSGAGASASLDDDGATDEGEQSDLTTNKRRQHLLTTILKGRSRSTFAAPVRLGSRVRSESSLVPRSHCSAQHSPYVDQCDCAHTSYPSEAHASMTVIRCLLSASTPSCVATLPTGQCTVPTSV